MVSFVAKRYRHSDGRKHREEIYTIHERNPGGHAEALALGGLVVTKDKVLAFIGPGYLCQDRPESIVDAASYYVWGDTIQEALENIKPNLLARL